MRCSLAGRAAISIGTPARKRRRKQRETKRKKRKGKESERASEPQVTLDREGNPGENGSYEGRRQWMWLVTQLCRGSKLSNTRIVLPDP